MSFLLQLKIVSVEKELKKDITIDESVLNDIKKIKSLLKNIDIGNESIDKIKKNDFEIMLLLREKGDENYNKVKTVLYKINEIAKEEENIPIIKIWVEKLLEALEISEELYLKEEYKILDGFHSLIIAYDLSEERIKLFLGEHSNFLKAKQNKRLLKKIKKALKGCAEQTQVMSKGPTVSEKEILQLKEKLTEYFQSDYFLKLVKNPNHSKLWGILGFLLPKMGI